MGSGSWTTEAFNNYVTTSRGVSVDEFETMKLGASQVYRSRQLAEELNPYHKFGLLTRECVDSEEHPYTVPVILALDVTGSMGGAAVEVAQRLNKIMTDIYADDSIKDVEFCIMGIGDLSYDDAPIQMSQFESDIRIAEQLDKIYFERGGGGNSYESYTAAWYMGLNHCKLDCWKRGQKGIIITMGDECPNPYLPANALHRVTGDKLQGDINTKDIKDEVLEKFDVYHISIDDRQSSYDFHASRYNLDESWKELIGEDNYFICGLDSLAAIITDIIVKHEYSTRGEASITVEGMNPNEVSWDI